MGSPLPSLPPSPPSFLSPPLEYTTSSSSFWCDRSFIIITSIISLVVLAAAAIHLLLRLRLRLRSARPPPPPSLSSSSSSSASSSASFSPLPFLLNLHPSVDNDTNFLIASLPLFSLSSSSSPRPSSSDCGVCLSRMAPNEELRLIPACSHAFHASCIDTWLRSTPSCPLCRSPLRPISAAPLPSPQHPAVELGIISRGRVSNAQEEEAKEEEGGGRPAVAEAAGGGSRSWLRDYADRLASSASTSLCLSGQ